MPSDQNPRMGLELRLDGMADLYEPKTPKTDADVDHIAGMFRPYSEARDRESREKPTR